MKILIATDGSKFGEEAVRQLAGFLSPEENTELKVISVVEPFSFPVTDAFGVVVDAYRETEKSAVSQAEKAIADARLLLESSLDENNVRITTELIREKYPKNAIVEMATEWGSDLVVVGSHGYGFWDRLLLGSVSSAVVHHAPCSVLVVRGNNNSNTEGPNE